ncbi:hypothetical protein DL766_005829 [Monosporascus sp. MC13-8B]|uniref:Protein SQS1 n=1 Tax=Monosporascus cannonballus TaxID=155416 RepID=A0ABY0HBQ7_9PEZI|nr:hypothetical protein DL762_004608 [Monosporascus cannonballus]RYO95909.1 hypothetical protein DL763_003457 [Monosporascus cannonballus]RYP28543.1 hypothetical protein DL766_005829 [Monosporascus sp. MC13-8B]
MPRGKNNNKHARPQGPRPGRRKVGGLLGKILADYNGDLSSQVSADNARGHGYSLAEEARNTAYNRRGKPRLDAKLRYQPVKFISAGFMDPLKDLEVEQKALSQTQPAQEARKPNPTTAEAPYEAHTPAEHVKTPEAVNEELSAPSFTLDLTGDKLLRPPQQPVTDAATPEPNCDSDSSGEVILFKGRGASRQNRSPAEPIQDTSGRHDSQPDTLELREMNLELRVVEKSIQNDEISVSQETARHHVQETVVKADDHIPLSTAAKRGPGHRAVSTSTTSDEEAAIIADYIANMQEDSDEGGDGDGADDGPVIGTHAFHMLRDLGGTDSDAIPEETSSAEHSSDGSVDDEIDEETQKRRLELEDERMARILAKQEELGLGSDEVVLYDDADSDSGEDHWQPAPKGTPRRKKKGSTKEAKIMQKRGQYPSATRMADAFDDLDPMDWHGPSLNNFKKGPKTFNVSDSELEEEMKMTWQKDRLKKAEKKKAREELRSQGLLGKNANPEDLRVKYRGGMTIDDLANELESFLIGTRQQLSLPPFDKQARMTVHQLANKFKIKSQSAGKGNDRYTILYRSRATRPFEQAFFEREFARIKRTWFPRVDVDEETVKQTRILKRAEPSKARGNHSLTYREGDVVGQHAAELGAENKGRTMLEKMGWSKGMALGTVDNKGIMVPITQVVKKNKAGLGDA